jgi:hypothetical protein
MTNVSFSPRRPRVEDEDPFQKFGPRRRETDESFVDEAKHLGEVRTALELVAKAAAMIDQLQKKADRFETLARTTIERTQEELRQIKIKADEHHRQSVQSEARAERAEKQVEESDRRAQEAEEVSRNLRKQMDLLSRSIIERLAPHLRNLEESE